MPRLARAGRRLSSLFWQESVRDEVDAELGFHVAMRAREYEQRGMSAEQARATALARFGDLPSVTNECRSIGERREREMRRSEWWREFTHDLRFAGRRLRRSPGFLAVTVLSLALGMGATVALFSVVRAVLLSPLPVPAAAELLLVTRHSAVGGGERLASGDFLDLRDGASSLRLAAWEPRELTLTENGEPVRLQAARVTPSFFEALRTRPVVGRGFVEDDALLPDPGGVLLDHTPLVVLSHALWQERFGGEVAVVGQTMMLDDRPHEIVGVMPRELVFPAGTQLWLPLAFGSAAPADRGGFYIQAFGRLAPGATRAQAQGDVDRVAASIAASPPAFNEGLRFPLQSLEDALVRDVRPALWILLGLSLLLLLLVCANVANLLLARAAARQREIAVRSALGAGRGRVLRQLLTESVALTALGAAGAVLVAWWSVRTLIGIAPPALARLADVSLDGTALALVPVLAVATGLLVGIAPALQLARADLRAQLGAGDRGASASHRTRRVQDLLVVGQLALAAVLLVGTGLLVRSYERLRAVDPGFRSSDVLVLELTLPQRYRTQGDVVTFTERVIDEVRAIPGVRDAGTTLRLPVVSSPGGMYFAPGRVAGDGDAMASATFHVVTPGHLSLLGIPLRRGRDLTAEDRSGAPLAVLVNEALAREHFAGRDPVGEEIVMGPWRDTPATIVGVAADVRQGGIAGEQVPAIYMAAAQVTVFTLRHMHLLLRTSVPPQQVASAARARVWSVDPNLAFARVATYDERLAELTHPTRFALSLVGGFGLLGLVLAASGIAGLTAYTVAQRTKEVSVRIALGARPIDVLRLMLAQGLRRTLLGLAIGIALALALTRVAAGLLFGVSATDPLTFIAIALFLTAVALAAIWIPARRAARVDPVEALRS